MEIRTDYFGQELEVGDYVLTSTTMGTARGFYVGVIERFTPKMTKCKQLFPKYNWRQDNGFSAYSNQLVKLEPEMVTMKLLRGQ